MVVRSSFAVVVFTGIGALIGFATVSEVQVTAQQQHQQQTMPPEQQQHHHPNISSNQSSVNSATEQGQKNMTMAMTTEGGEMMMTTTNDQTFTASSISLVNGVKVVSISPINNDHIAVNLRYETSDQQPPGVSVVALTNSSLDTIMNGMMQNSTLASAANSTLPLLSMQSGSNYLEAGWQPQHPNSATVLVQLNGEIPDGDHVMVLVVPFLHH
ncbi:MAG: hypothetical protein ACJ70P_01075 [Nitrososphaera sp.]